MQRFLTESPWDDDAVIGRLQEYLSPRLGHPEAVWVLDGSDFPKQGRKPAGVARQYCGRLGKVANCRAGMFLAYVSPLGRSLVEKRLYLPESWTSNKGRCIAAGVPEERRKLAPGSPAALREKAKASIRAKSLPPSPIGGGTPLSGRKEAIRLRQEPALAKAGVRYRGLAKNRERMALLLGCPT